MPVPPTARYLVVGFVATLYLLALLVLLTGPWGSSLNRLTVDLYVFFRTDVPIAPDAALPQHYGGLLNVALFVPFGLCAAVLRPWPWWRVAILAGLVSATVEVVQSLWLDRVGDWVDVVANTLGAVLGALAVSLVGRLRRSPGRR